MELSLPQHDQPIINIAGEKVALGPIRRDLLQLHYKWANDFEIWHTMLPILHPRPYETQEEWYKRASIGKSRDEIFFLIYERETMRPIGATDLNHIDLHARTANFSIFIGEKDCWGKGYGTEATRLMLDYGFNGLSLHNIMLWVYSHNKPAISAYTRAGFRVIGRRREAYHLGGQTHDVIFMDCLASEFQSPVLQHMLDSED